MDFQLQDDEITVQFRILSQTEVLDCQALVKAGRLSGQIKRVDPRVQLGRAGRFTSGFIESVVLEASFSQK
jgi:hypothetical protein